MADPTIGQARIVVTPDTTRFQAQLQAQLTRALRTVERSVGGGGARTAAGAGGGTGAVQRTARASANAEIREAQRAAREVLRIRLRQERASDALNRQRTRSLEQAAFRERQLAERTATSIGATAKKIGLATTVALTGIAASGLKAAASFETLKTALAGMEETLGTTGQDAFNQLQKFAATTPFSLQGVTDAVIQLSAALDTNLTESLDVLTVLGNAAAAAGKGTEQVQAAALAITQIGARGKLSAQELNQLANAIPSISRVKVFDVLAAAMGNTRTEVQALAEQGLVPADLALRSILQVAQEAPGALGAMERQARTFGGVMNNLKDNLILFLGTAFEPVASAIAEAFGPLGQDTDTVREFAEVIGAKLGKAFKEILPDIVSFVKQLPEFTRDFVDLATKVGKVVGPLIDAFKSVVTVLGAVGDAVGFVVDGFSKLNNVAESIGKGIRKGLSFITGGLINDLPNGAKKAQRGLSELFDGAAKAAGNFQKTVIPAFEGFSNAVEEAFDSSLIDSVISADKELTSAIKGLAAAQQDLVDAETRLTELRDSRGTLAAEHAAEIEAEKADIAENAARAQERLVDAEERTADAREQLLEVTSELAEALKPATLDEIAEATDEITLAEINLARARQAVLDIQEKLDALERRRSRSGQRLAALGLDQLRTNINAARLTLNANRGLEEEEDLRTQLIEAQIAERDALRDLGTEQENLNVLKGKGLETDKAVIQARRAQAQAQRDLSEAERQQVAAQKELNDAQNTTLLLAPLLKQQLEDRAALEKQITEAEKAQVVALAGIKTATTDLALANGALRQSILNLQDPSRTEIQNLIEKINLYRDLGTIGSGAYNQIANALVQGVVAGVTIQQGPNGELLLVVANPAATGSFFGGGANRTSVRPFREGGIVTRPTHSLLGEGFRKEVILPLQNPQRTRYLANQSGLFDVLAKTAPVPSRTGRLSRSSLSNIGSGGGASKEDALLREIRRLNSKIESMEMKQETNNFEVKIENPANDPLLVRQLRREWEKTMDRRR